MRPEIKLFAEALTKAVRDRAIRDAKVHLRDNAKGPAALRWKAAIAGGVSKEAVEMIAADTVDAALFYLFDAMDNELVDLHLRTPGGEMLGLYEEGLSELAGWYLGDWRYDYSDEQVYEPR